MNESERTQIRERAHENLNDDEIMVPIVELTASARDVLALDKALTEAERELVEHTKCEAAVAARADASEEKDAKEFWRDRAKAAEARSAKLEEALAMLWAYYLLPISNEQVAQVKAALAPAPPTDGSET